MSQPNKTYIGDGVYVEYQPDVAMLKLTTEDGVTTSNTIYLEGSVFAALVKFADRILAAPADSKMPSSG